MSKDNQLVVVITGSSRGIGRGIAKVLGERGATVYVTGRTEVSGTQKSPNGDPVPGSIHEVAVPFSSAFSVNKVISTSWSTMRPT